MLILKILEWLQIQYKIRSTLRGSCDEWQGIFNNNLNNSLFVVFAFFFILPTLVFTICYYTLSPCGKPNNSLSDKITVFFFHLRFHNVYHQRDSPPQTPPTLALNQGVTIIPHPLIV